MTRTVSEPAWLAGRREAALERYGALPVPTNREEAWRFTNLRGFDPDAYEVQQPELVLNEADVPDGVWFGSIARAVEECPELVERHYGTVVADDEKFAAGNAAAWRDGVFLHVPAGVEVAVPLRASLQLAEAGAVHYRALIVLSAARGPCSARSSRPPRPATSTPWSSWCRGRGAARIRDHAAAPSRGAPVRHPSGGRRA